MTVIDIKDATIRLIDGTEPIPKTMSVKIGEGNLTYNETRNREYVLDKGQIDSVRDGDEAPLELSFDIMWEEISATVGSGIPTVEDALKKRGDALAWVTSGGDVCEPYAVDVELEIDAGCVDANGVPVKDREIHTFPEYRYESLNHDLRAGTVATSGMCNRLEARVEHATAAALAAAFLATQSEFLSATDSATISFTADFSMIAWIRPDSISGTQGLVTKWDIGTDHEYALYMEDAKLRFEIDAAANDALGTTYIQSNTDLVANEWYMVAIVYDGTGVGNAGRLQMYLDGVLEGSATYVGTIPALIDDGAADLHLGAFDSGANFYEGRIGMTALWARQLLLAEIVSIYKGGLGKLHVELTAAELVSLNTWWNMGEASGSRADSSGNAITLADNATVLSASGVRALQSTGILP